MMVTVAGNPVLSCPDASRMDEAFAALDAMVSVDIYINETTRHADVILPPPSALEKSHYDLAFYGISVRNVANFSEPVFDNDGPAEEDILAKLALIGMGFGPDADPAIVHDQMVTGLLEAEIDTPESPVSGRDEATRDTSPEPSPRRPADYRFGARRQSGDRASAARSPPSRRRRRARCTAPEARSARSRVHSA